MTGPRSPVVDAFGARWVLDAHGLGEPLAGRLAALWARAVVVDGDARADDPGAAVHGSGDTARFVVRRQGEEVHIDGAAYRVSDAAVPYAVSRALTVASIGRRAGECLLLHAAGIARTDGRTVALVAGSGTGKTTAARVLGRSFGYVSDETVAVESDLVVRGYPKPLSLVRDPSSPHDKEESAPDVLGLLRAPDRLRLGGVVLLHRDPETAEPRLEEIDLVEAAVSVVPQTSALLRMPDPMGSLARALGAGGGPWRLTYRDIADCTELVAGVLARDDVAPREHWTAEQGPDAGRDSRTAQAAPLGVQVGDLTGTATVRRAPWRHALHTRSGSLVVVGSVPLGLPGMASTLWRAAVEPTPVTGLVEAAVRAHGPHPHAATVVTETVRGLLGSGAFEPGA